MPERAILPPISEMRYMTPEERAEFEAISQTMVRPLSKPLLRFPPSVSTTTGNKPITPTGSASE